MRKLFVLVTLSALVGLIAAEGLLDNIITPSLDKFSPADNGVWYFNVLHIKMIPVPGIPHYKINVEVIVLPDGKHLRWTANIGEGTVRGILVDTTSERYSTCEIEKRSPKPREVAVQLLIIPLCGQVRSMRRITKDWVMAVMVSPEGEQSIHFQRTKPTFLDTLYPLKFLRSEPDSVTEEPDTIFVPHPSPQRILIPVYRPSRPGDDRDSSYPFVKTAPDTIFVPHQQPPILIENVGQSRPNDYREYSIPFGNVRPQEYFAPQQQPSVIQKSHPSQTDGEGKSGGFSFPVFF